MAREKSLYIRDVDPGGKGLLPKRGFVLLPLSNLPLHGGARDLRLDIIGEELLPPGIQVLKRLSRLELGGAVSKKMKVNKKRY
jgi:hypothetical protein